MSFEEFHISWQACDRQSGRVEIEQRYNRKRERGNEGKDEVVC